MRTASEAGREVNAPTCNSASAASTAATRPRSTSSTRSGWTTSPARRSGCRWPVGRRAAEAERGAGRSQRSAEAAAPRSEERAGEVLAAPCSTRGSSLPTAPKSASEVLARLVAVVVGGTAHHVDQPVERVVHVAAEHVEVGDHRLRVDVVGAGRGGRARPPGGRRPGCAGAAWPSRDRRRPRCRRGCRRRASGTPRRPARCRPRRARPARRRTAGRRSGSSGSSAAARGAATVERGWCRPVMPCAVSCCTELLEQRCAARRGGSTSWNSGVAGRPSRSTNSIGTCGICMAWAIAGEASMSTRPARNRPSYSPATASPGRRPGGALGRLRAGVEDQQHGRGHRGLEQRPGSSARRRRRRTPTRRRPRAPVAPGPPVGPAPGGG